MIFRSSHLVLIWSILVVHSAPAASPDRPLAGRAEVQAALAFLKADEPRTLEEQVRICEIPAPPFEEAKRGQYFVQAFTAAGLQEVRVDAVGNVIGVRPGRVTSPTLVLSAHLDTVFPAGTDTTVKRSGTLLKAPGIADDCRGLAALLAVLRVLNAKSLATDGTVVFVATVGEEGLGDLRGVRHLFEKELAGKITHFISLDGSGLRVVSGAVGSNRYQVTFRAPGGHSYGMFGLVNPIHALGRAVEKIARLEVPDDPKTTFNVGRIEGGTSVNSIAQSAWFEIDLRSADAAALEAVDAAFRAAVTSAVEEENAFWGRRTRSGPARMTNRANPVTVEIKAVGRRPTGRVADDAPILQAVRRANAALGIEARFEASSTDANVPISLGIPAVTLPAGGESTGNHALQEQFDSKDSHLGTQRALLAVLEIVGLQPAR
ncbi:MAG: M20/M25/M40 family metallo-hydrolase [Opitutaceae bacterium]